MSGMRVQNYIETPAPSLRENKRAQSASLKPQELQGPGWQIVGGSAQRHSSDVDYCSGETVAAEVFLGIFSIPFASKIRVLASSYSPCVGSCRPLNQKSTAPVLPTLIEISRWAATLVSV